MTNEEVILAVLHQTLWGAPVQDAEFRNCFIKKIKNESSDVFAAYVDRLITTKF